MQFLLKGIISMIVTVLLQGGVANIVSTTPEDAAKDFLEGLKNNEPQVMEKYMDNSYINFICNVEGDEGVVDRMDDALFQKRHSAPPHKNFAKSTGTTDGGTAMKKLNGKYKPSLSLSVIEAARAGEADAMEQILQHYDAYINKLCLRTMIDESGQTHI